MKTKERKFITPVSMKCTQEQFERDLRKQLENLGHTIDNIQRDWHVHDFIVAGYNIAVELIVVKETVTNVIPGFATKPVFTVVKEYNPELFLALAAMSEGDQFWPEEWVVCTNVVTGGGWIKKGLLYKFKEIDGEIIRVSLNGEISAGKDNYTFRKATKGEILEHFIRQDIINQTNQLGKEVEEEKISANHVGFEKIKKELGYDEFLGKNYNPDQVNHPPHYGGEDNPYEAIKIIEAMGWGYEFCMGNVIKYKLRAGKKEGQSKEQDEKKADWYLNRANEIKLKQAKE